MAQRFIALRPHHEFRVIAFHNGLHLFHDASEYLRQSRRQRCGIAHVIPVFYGSQERGDDRTAQLHKPFYLLLFFP